MVTRWTFYAERKCKHGSAAIGLRLRSWALPLLVTFTPTLWEVAIGPFFVSRDWPEEIPF